MSFISKDHFNMALKGVKRLLNQKVDKSELDGAIINGVRPIFSGFSSAYHSQTTKLAKVSAVNGLEFSLESGVIVIITFSYDSSTKVGGIKLDVNSTGAKQVVLGSQNNNSIPAYFWKAYDKVGFMYDGANWVMLFKTPRDCPLSTSVTSTSTTVGATSSAVKEAYDLANKALPKSGGTLTGNLTLKGDPTSNLQAATKRYVDNAVKNIPEQVQTDWNQNSPDALDYVKNRTHYKIGGEVVVDEQTLITVTQTQTDSGSTEFGVKIPAVSNPFEECFVGELYDVYFNGVLYVCPIRYDGIINNYLGNETLCTAAASGDDTGEPFLIHPYVHNDGLSMETSEPMEFTLKIIRHKIVYPINEEFIPDTIARKTDIPGVVIKSQTATVGQTIIVSKVDSDGKPVEWEYMDPWVLTDQNTSIRYRLSVIEGKLTMDIVESEVYRCQLHF